MRALRSAWILLLAASLLGAMGPFPLAAQEQEETEPREPEEAAEAPATGLDQIDEILLGDMESAGGYSYDPGGRRDPFKSLLAARERSAARGPRPEGIPGLLIDEIDLTGIFIMLDGPIAQVQSADKDESHLLRVGDQVFDGDVVSIDSNEVTFRQIVDDPTALKPFREVVKRLNP